MDLASRRAQTRRTLRRIGYAWCALVGIVGTIGGVLGCIEREDDDET